MIGNLIRKLPNTPKFVYRDHLSKSDKPSVPKKLQRCPNIVDIYGDEYIDVVTDSKPPLLSLDDTDEKEVSNSKGLSCDNKSNSSTGTNKSGNMKVKVLMTKKDAEMLLSKCKETNTLDFKDVITELSRLPARQIDVVSVFDVAPYRSTGRGLPTIHEED